MAIAFDAASQRHQDAGGGTTSTWSHTCTGSNGILFVGTEVGAGNTISGVTYNSVAMTQVQTGATGGGTFDNFYLFYLIGPATGANNIVVTASASTFIYSAATSYIGAAQTSPIDVSTTAINSATTVTASVTTTVDNDWTVAFCSAGANNGGSFTPNGTGTARVTDDSTGFWYFMSDSNGAITPAGSATLNGIRNPSSPLGIAIAAFKPSAAATATSHNLSTLGVGS